MRKRELEERIRALEARVAQLEQRPPERIWEHEFWQPQTPVRDYFPWPPGTIIC